MKRNLQINKITGIDMQSHKCYFINKPLKLIIEQNDKKQIRFIYMRFNKEDTLYKFYRSYANEYFHPHCATGTCCLGGYHTILDSAVRNGDIKSFMTTLKRYLQSVDITDTWGASLLSKKFIFFNETLNKYYLIDNGMYNYTSYVVEFKIVDNELLIDNLYLYARVGLVGLYTYTIKLEKNIETICLPSIIDTFTDKVYYLISNTTGARPYKMYINGQEEIQEQEIIRGKLTYEM